MSLADELFIARCRDILDNGTSREGEKVRPHWEDGSSAYTIKKFGVVKRYDVSKEIHSVAAYAFARASFRSAPVAVMPSTRPPFVTISPLSLKAVPAW